MGEGSFRTILIEEAVSGGGFTGQEPPESWAAEGSAIRRALVADFAAVPGVVVVEPIDARYLDDRPRPPNVARIVTDRDHPIDRALLMGHVDAAVVVAPEEDGTLSSLAWLGEEFGLPSLGARRSAILLCADKAALAGFFERIGIPTPPTRTFRRRDGLPEVPTQSGRVVVKPVRGEGAIDTWVLDAATRQLPATWRRRTGLIQPYRPGPACSASFLIDRGGRAHLIAVGRQEIEVAAAGAVRYAGGEVPVACSDEDLIPLRRAVEAVPGLLGFVGVDFIRVEPTGAVEVIEINPRVTTSIVGLVRLAPPGTIARAWLAALGIDLPGEPAPPASFQSDAAFRAIRSAPPVRFWADGTILPGAEGGE